MAIAVIRKSGLRPSVVIVRLRFATPLLKGSRMPSFHSEAVYKSKAMLSRCALRSSSRWHALCEYTDGEGGAEIWARLTLSVGTKKIMCATLKSYQFGTLVTRTEPVSSYRNGMGSLGKAPTVSITACPRRRAPLLTNRPGWLPEGFPNVGSIALVGDDSLRRASARYPSRPPLKPYALASLILPPTHGESLDKADKGSRHRGAGPSIIRLRWSPQGRQIQGFETRK